VEVKFHSFLTPVLVGDEGSTSRTSCFTTRIKTNTRCIGGWVGFRAALDIWEKKQFLLLVRVEPWTVCPIAQSQYKLCHPIPSHYKRYMATSTKYLLKWTTFHLKWYANSVLNKFIQSVQVVPTEWSAGSSRPNTIDGSLRRI